MHCQMRHRQRKTEENEHRSCDTKTRQTSDSTEHNKRESKQEEDG